MHSPSEVWWRSWRCVLGEAVREWYSTQHPDNPDGVPDNFTITSRMDPTTRMRTVTVQASQDQPRGAR